MPKYQVLFCTDFKRWDVSVKEIPSSRIIDDKLEEKCRQDWEKDLKEAKNNGQWLWDSETYRLEEVIRKGRRITFLVSTIPFSVRIEMNKHSGKIEKLGPRYAPMGMYCSCFVRSSDNYLLFIEKSSRLRTNRKHSFVGGIFSKSEKILGNGNDLFSEVLKEVFEEITVGRTDVARITLKAGYVSENFNVCLIFDVRLKLTAEKIIESFKAASTADHPETKNIISVPDGSINKIIRFLPKRDYPKFHLFSLDK